MDALLRVRLRRFVIASLLVGGLVAAGCGGGAAQEKTAAAPTQRAAAPASPAVPQTTAAQPTTAAPKAATVPAAAPAATAAPPTAAPTAAAKTAATAPAQEKTTAQTAAKSSEIEVRAIATGLDTPWAIGFAPDGQMFVTERAGQLRVVENGKLREEPLVKLPVTEVGESGLTGLAVDPKFPEAPYLYVLYSYTNNQQQLRNRLARLRVEGQTAREDKVLLDDLPGGRIHNGGRVRFGPDGMLYAALGDAANPPLAQDPQSRAGQVVRLKPDGSIPEDNPFPNSPAYAIGLRNVQGLAWQPGTGRLYVTEHGPTGEQNLCCRDEVNFVEAGKNYGWPVITGDQQREGMVAPIIHSGASDTWAPAGAAFASRGPWAGSLLFASLRGQTLYRLTLDPNDPRKVQNLEPLYRGEYGRLRDVVEGPDGALYVTTSNKDGRGNPKPEDDQILRIGTR